MIPRGNEYAKQVEDAIKSKDASQKLNVLLVGELQYFSNVQDVLVTEERLIITFLGAIAFAVALLFIRKALVRLYPLSFFAFETQKPLLSKLQRESAKFWASQ